VVVLKDSGQIKDIKPVLSGYIMEAQYMLDPAVKPDETTVHDVRVLMKKARATARLLKTQLDKETFRREYSALREVGRIMRLWRETSVHRRLLKSLRKKQTALFNQLSEFPNIALLLEKTEPSDILPPGMKEEIDTIITILHKTAYRWRFMSIKNPDPGLLLEELAITFNRAALCYLNARVYPKSTNIHEFRKMTKDFLYQLYYFRSIRPKVVRNLEKDLDLIAQNLGKYNDHSTLISALDFNSHPTENIDPLNELVVLIKKEQDRYLSRVWPVAYRIFRPGQKLTDILRLKQDIFVNQKADMNQP
jgi:CHAD domain-containing protein